MKVMGSNFSEATQTTALDYPTNVPDDLSFISRTLTSGSEATSICSVSPNRTSFDDQNGFQVYNYKSRDFQNPCPNAQNCEEICVAFCRKLGILPATNLLFGLRVFDNDKEWIAPNQPLVLGMRYCFRMRFKVASLDTQLRTLDPEAYEYLYQQMRFDMVMELIPEIRYPAKKDNVMGLGMVDMYIDYLTKRHTAKFIKSNYKKYLPRSIVKAHKIFVKSRICNSFEEYLKKDNIDLDRLKWTYIHEINTLAPNYLAEMFSASVDYIPEDEESNNFAGNNAKIPVLVKIDLEDNFDLKICRKTSESMNSEWYLLAKLKDFYHVITEGTNWVDLEVTGIPKPYRMIFEQNYEMVSFITYLSGYLRLTTKWHMNISKHYASPSLLELKQLDCHGPIGGNFSFAKIREKQGGEGSYIIRQCEKEYDVYYIDINTKQVGNSREKFKTETFKITRDYPRWILHMDNENRIFENLNDLAQSIPTESNKKNKIKPSEYDKAPLLLICLPKILKTQMSRTEVNEKELLRRRVQVLHPKIDLQWYQESEQNVEDQKIKIKRADWIQEGKFKEVPVTLKVLDPSATYSDFADFMKLVDIWSGIYSPHFIKLCGITISTPYTMVLEHAKFGPLNEFLNHNKNKISKLSLLSIVHGLVRGITDLKKENIIHGYIRCSNIYVTKFDLKANILETKIGDPGIKRAYTNEDLPWIPVKFYKCPQDAKNNMKTDHWAFATTLWEIFSLGTSVNHLSDYELEAAYRKYKAILPPPKGFSQDMYEIMKDGWSFETDRSFNQQEIFEKLTFAKQYMQRDYENPNQESENTLVSFISSACEGPKPENGERFDPFSFNQSKLSSQPTSDYFNDTYSVIQIPNGKIICKEKIGEGHYGTVHLGEIKFDSSDKANEKVAIKTLKLSINAQLNADFKREIEIMESLCHPNIVKIKFWIQQPMSIIMEYVEGGSFLEYITVEKYNLKNSQLLQFALEIAEGMAYLRSKKIIHRDLAARNILCNSDCVKISDFGLAQIANTDGYYFSRNVRDIPIKWYSPESIKTGKFSFHHDVWSYGVTLFEMFSRGEDPNLDGNLSKDQIFNRLENGERLKRPQLCPPPVYNKIMMPCWEHNPKSRPSFTELIEIIKKIQTIIEDYD